MKTSDLLERALEKQEKGVRRSFERLEDHERIRVEAAYRRHADACEKSGISADPCFIRESIADVIFESSSYRQEHPLTPKQMEAAA